MDDIVARSESDVASVRQSRAPGLWPIGRAGKAFEARPALQARVACA
jgi:hypothetical protein